MIITVVAAVADVPDPVTVAVAREVPGLLRAVAHDDDVVHVTPCKHALWRYDVTTAKHYRTRSEAPLCVRFLMLTLLHLNFAIQGHRQIRCMFTVFY